MYNESTKKIISFKFKAVATETDDQDFKNDSSPTNACKRALQNMSLNSYEWSKKMETLTSLK